MSQPLLSSNLLSTGDKIPVMVLKRASERAGMVMQSLGIGMMRVRPALRHLELGMASINTIQNHTTIFLSFVRKIDVEICQGERRDREEYEG
jgi:hypothetical protein